MSIRDIIQTATSNMFQKKIRTGLTIMAIFISALTLTLTNGVGAGISTYIDEQVASLGAENVLFISKVVEQEEDLALPEENQGPEEYDPEKATSENQGFREQIQLITDDDISVLNNIDNLNNVQPMIFPNTEYAFGLNETKYILPTDTYVSGTNIDLVAGTIFSNDTTTFEVTIPKQHVSYFGFESNEAAIGQELVIGIKNSQGEIQEVAANIIGIQEKNIINESTTTLNYQLASHLFAIQTEGLPSSETRQFFRVTGEFPADFDEQHIIALQNNLQDAGYSAQTIQDQIGILKEVINGIVNVFNVFGGIALLAASFGVVNTLYMSVQERTKEIGIMKAMGMSNRGIFFLFSIEATLLGFWGSAFGVLAAIGIGQVANRYAANTFLKDFEGLDLLSFPIHYLLIITGIIMLITFVAGTLPARKAAKLDPIEALRYE